MPEPFDPDLLRQALRQVIDDDARVEAVVERGTRVLQRLSVPRDAYPLLAVSLLAGDDRRVLAAQVAEAVRAERAVPPDLVTMVTTAVLARLDVDDPVATVCTVLDRGADLAARHVSYGSTHIVTQIAAYRAALDELTGSAGDVAEYVTSLAPLADSPDVMRTFARFLGGELISTEPDLPPLEEVACGDTLPDEETITSWLLAELYAGTSAAQRRVMTSWLTGLRSPTDQDDLAFLVDRVRRVERRLQQCPSTPPNPISLPEQVCAVLRAHVRDGFALPPLWTDRSAAVSLIASKLRLETGQGWPTSMLVAGVVVRGLGQEVHRASDPDRPHDCGCGAGSRPPDEVCPHRPWPEHGRVEDYTTLARAARVGDESLAQLHLKRYQGLWQEWVDDARERVD